MVEWSITAVLKTVDLRGSGGSNPSSSALSQNSLDNLLIFSMLFYFMAFCIGRFSDGFNPNMHVNEFQYQGKLVIALDEASDFYRIYFVKAGRVELQRSNVGCYGSKR